MLQSHLRSGQQISELFGKGIDYFLNLIQLMMKLLNQITRMPKRTKLRSLESQKALLKPYKSKTTIEIPQIKKPSLKTET